MTQIELLKDYMLRLDLSQVQFAKLAKISRITLYYWLSGKIAIPKAQFLKLRRMMIKQLAQERWRDEAQRGGEL